jgi:hypothetical protein
MRWELRRNAGRVWFVIFNQAIGIFRRWQERPHLEWQELPAVRPILEKLPNALAEMRRLRQCGFTGLKRCAF